MPNTRIVSVLAAIIAGASLAGCALEDFGQTKEEPVAAAPVPPPPDRLSYQVSTDAGLKTYTDRLAAYALKCWVRDDPGYRIGGPVPTEGAYDIYLLVVDPEAAAEASQAATAVQALRLRVARATDVASSVSVIATGPLAKPEYAPRIQEGAVRAGAGLSDCPR